MTTNNTKLINRIDGAILGFNKKIVTKYTNNINHTKSNLEEELYCGSAILLGLNMVLDKEYILSVPIAIQTTQVLNPKWRPRGADYEYKVFGETLGEILTYANVTLYCAGAASVVGGLGGIAAGAVTQNPETLKASFKILGYGLGFFGLMSANYISKVEIEPQKIVDK